MNAWHDSIEQTVSLDAPIDTVWKAVTDHEHFGSWFRVALDQPFQEGGKSTGKMTYPGHEGVPWLARVEKIEPQSLFSLRWYDYDPDRYPRLEDAPAMLVDFHFEAHGDDTIVTIVESGFASMGEERGRAAMQRNKGDWELQASNLCEYVSAL